MMIFVFSVLLLWMIRVSQNDKIIMWMILLKIIFSSIFLIINNSFNELAPRFHPATYGAVGTPIIPLGFPRPHLAPLMGRHPVVLPHHVDPLFLYQPVHYVRSTLCTRNNGDLMLYFI
jgi:hypothetical protein